MSAARASRADASPRVDPVSPAPEATMTAAQFNRRRLKPEPTPIGAAPHQLFRRQNKPEPAQLSSRDDKPEPPLAAEPSVAEPISLENKSRFPNLGKTPKSQNTGRFRNATKPPIAAEPAVADVVLADVVVALSAALAERDAAISGLVALIAEVRADHAVLAARVDVLDPPDDTPLPGYCSLKEAAFASDFCAETIRQWARDGEVTGIKNGAGWRVELASVMERAGRR
jgi:hypothetical protein